MEDVNLKEVEIAKVKKENWQTNCSLLIDGVSFNIQTASLERLIEALAWLLNKKDCYEKACEILEVKTNNLYSLYSFDEWVSDVKERSRRILVEAEKQKLSRLKTRLAGLMSEDAKAARELEEIGDLLK